MTHASAHLSRVTQAAGRMTDRVVVAALIGALAIPSAANAQVEQPYNDGPQRPPILTKGFKGALPNPLLSYANDPDAFLDFVRRKSWFGWDRRRKCVHHNNCNGGAANGWMRAQAIEDANDVPLTGLPANGVVVGRMMNIGLYDDATTLLPRVKGYYDEYYFIVVNDPKDPTIPQLWVAPLLFDQYGKPIKPMDIKRALNDYRSCHHEKKPHAEGDFRDCNTKLGADGKPVKTQGGRPFVSTTDAYAWFSCAEGCCVAQWPPSARDKRDSTRMKR